MQPDVNYTPVPWTPNVQPPPVPELAHAWRAVIVLDVTPICPLCADALVPNDISSILAVVFCQACATGAKASNWPEPYDFSHVFDRRDLIHACGLYWYHPRDGSQEPAMARHERLEAHAIEAERFRVSRLN